MTPELPPKPDPQTGEPRPPRAPLERGWRAPASKHKRGRSKVAEPPEGEGPILEWFYPTRGSNIMIGLLMSLVIVVFLCIRDFGFSWMATWWLWLFVIPWPFFFMLSQRSIRISAGADWLIYNKSGLIKTYELTKVNVKIGGAAHYLDIEDRHGNGISTHVLYFQFNRELWDLVYNGILHSVHEQGAETNQLAKGYLQLDLPPQHREQR